jgi:hypothetical protein
MLYDPRSPNVILSILSGGEFMHPHFQAASVRFVFQWSIRVKHLVYWVNRGRPTFKRSRVV